MRKNTFTNYVKILFRNVSFDRHISQDGNKSIRARYTAVLSQDSIKATRIAARRTFSYVYQNFDNTEVSEKEVAVGPRVGKEGAKGKWRKRRGRWWIEGPRDVGRCDRLRRYMHNNRGMESCIRAKQPICPVQWK